MLAIACPRANPPPLLWNITPSVPTGLYRIAPQQPTPGALAVVRLPEPLLTLADARRYLPGGTLLIKRVAARLGDIVCRHGAIVTINGRRVVRARSADAMARPLPRWIGCRRLNGAQAFLLSTDPDSFDSRYFGPVDRRQILGAALPVWVGRSR